MNVALFGISNCDTVRRARAWLAQHAVEVDFHDFRKAGVPAERLDVWLCAVGWQALLNRNGTTWRKLDETARAAALETGSARALMLAHASIIRRPVVEWPNGVISVGFDAPDWARQLAEEQRRMRAAARLGA